MNASLSGGFTSFAFQSFFIGVIGFGTALVAQYFGSKKFHNCPRVLTQSIVFSFVSALFILALIPAGRWILATVGISDGEVLQAQAYLTIHMAGTGLDLFRNSFNNYFGGLGKTRVVLLATFVMALANISANYVLIFGKLGFPELGIEGQHMELSSLGSQVWSHYASFTSDRSAFQNISFCRAFSWIWKF